MTRPKLAALGRTYPDPPVILCAADDCGELGSWGGERGPYCVHHAPLSYFPSGRRPIRRPHGPSARPASEAERRDLCRRWREGVASNQWRAGR